jgi:hypothetical protein
MPLRKDFMATPLDENLDQVYTEENPMPGVATGEKASGGQSHSDDCEAMAGITFTESPFERSISRVYNSEKKTMNVQHFLQATSVIIGKKRHRF